MPALAALLTKARARGIFGTKMRSVIKQAHTASIKDIVRQQCDVAGQISAAGLVPIIEPEVDIHCPDKAGAADVSFIAGEVTMILDGVGLMGHDDHTLGETADLSTLPSQTKRAAIAIYRLTRR